MPGGGSILLIAALILAAAIVWGGLQVVAELRALRREIGRSRVLEVLTAFRAASEAAAADPRAVLAWEPLARAARQLFPEEFAELDRAAGSRFPFGADRIEAAHAQWTADWLSWERTHDADYKAKAAAAEAELVKADDAVPLRARLDAIEREKLERYQQRYGEYIKVAKALQGLMPGRLD